MSKKKKYMIVKTPFEQNVTHVLPRIEYEGQDLMWFTRPCDTAPVFHPSAQVKYLDDTFPKCPNFTDLLRAMTRDEITLSQRILEAIGSTLLQDGGKKHMFLIQGGPRSGKDVLLKTIQSLFDNDSIKLMDAASLRNGFEASEWEGKALCIWPEVGLPPIRWEAAVKLNEVLNMSTGPDGGSTSYFLATSYPFFTQWRVEDFPDRLVTIPLAGEIPEEMRSPAFFEKIIEERDAIATNAAQCYDEVRKRNGGFNGYYPINSIPMPPPCEKICTNKEESVRQFAETHCERIPGTGTDTCILHDSFMKKYGYISFTEFLDLFERNARELCGAERAHGSNLYDINFHSYFPYIHLRDNDF